MMRKKYSEFKNLRKPKFGNSLKSFQLFETFSRIIIDVRKSNKFAEKSRNKIKMINFSQKFRKYTKFFPNYDLAKLKQIRTMKVCNKIKNNKI